VLRLTKFFFRLVELLNRRLDALYRVFGQDLLPASIYFCQLRRKYVLVQIARAVGRHRLPHSNVPSRQFSGMTITQEIAETLALSSPAAS